MTDATGTTVRERCGTRAPAMEQSPVVLVPMFGAHATVFGFDPDCDRIDVRGTLSAHDLEFCPMPSGCTIVVKFGSEVHQTLTLEGVSASAIRERHFVNLAPPSRTSVLRRLAPRWSPALPNAAAPPVRAPA